MKSLLIMSWILVLFVSPLTVAADVDRYIDFLEPGNPGGWGTSLKTWDVEHTMKVGDTVEIDVWLGDIGGGGVAEASFFATYDPSKLTVVDVKAYDGSVLQGPWDSGGVSIFAASLDSYYVDLIDWTCVQPDREGHTIIARLWIRKDACGDTAIQFSDLPVL